MQPIAEAPSQTCAESGPAMALPQELSIYTAAELHAQWLAWLGQQAGNGGTAQVQAAAVESVDAAGLQLLLSLQHALQGQGQQLALLDPSPALVQGCEAIGLQAWLNGHAVTQNQEACA